MHAKCLFFDRNDGLLLLCMLILLLSKSQKTFWNILSIQGLRLTTLHQPSSFLLKHYCLSSIKDSFWKGTSNSKSKLKKKKENNNSTLCTCHSCCLTWTRKAAQWLCWHAIRQKRWDRWNNSIIRVLDKSGSCLWFVPVRLITWGIKRTEIENDTCVLERNLCCCTWFQTSWLFYRDNHSDCKQSFERMKERNIQIHSSRSELIHF